MLNNLLTVEDVTWGFGDLTLQKDAENTMDGTCQQQASFKKSREWKDTYIYNKKETVDIYDTHKREKGLEN